MIKIIIKKIKTYDCLDLGLTDMETCYKLVKKDIPAVSLSSQTGY